MYVSLGLRPFLYQGVSIALFAILIVISVLTEDSSPHFAQWTTTYDRTQLFARADNSSIRFKDFRGTDTDRDENTYDALITIDDTKVYQTIYGFGATLTDASAMTLSSLKYADSDAYSDLMYKLFDTSEDADAAGINYLRVPIGVTDFSYNHYTWDDVSNDTSFESFSLKNVPSEVFNILQDIVDINPGVKLHLCPWTPPAWMKDSNSLEGGWFLPQNNYTMADYLLKSVQAFEDKGFAAYAISVQNEPQYLNYTVPTTNYTVSALAAVAVRLRTLLDLYGYESVRVIGYEHNWDSAGTYATALMTQPGAYDAFAGVAFHSYEGKVWMQDIWHDNFPEKELYFTESVQIPGQLIDWWPSLGSLMATVFISALSHWAQSGLMWNLATDSLGNATLPGTGSCNLGCRPIVSIDNSTTITINQEYYAIAHASKAIMPVDGSNEFGRRISVSCSLESEKMLVGAYATKLLGEGHRYSLVVYNNETTTTETTTAINFRKKQMLYTFPVGVTTLSWID